MFHIKQYIIGIYSNRRGGAEPTLHTHCWWKKRSGTSNYVIIIILTKSYMFMIWLDCLWHPTPPQSLLPRNNNHTYARFFFTSLQNVHTMAQPFHKYQNGNWTIIIIIWKSVEKMNLVCIHIICIDIRLWCVSRWVLLLNTIIW